MLVLNIVLAALPSILLLLWFRRLDQRKPEPGGLVLKMFLLGCFAIIPAVIAEFSLGLFRIYLPRGIRLMYDAFVVAAFCEETVKLLTVRLFAWNQSSFDEVMDGIIYTVAAGLGFAFLENVFYSIGSSRFVGILLIRGLTAVPLHALCSAFIGYFLGMSRVTNKASPLPGLLIAILFHGLYDWFLFTGKLQWGLLIIPLLIVGYLLLGLLVRNALWLDREAGRTS